jgi:effector-binding domain-containing protein
VSEPITIVELRPQKVAGIRRTFPQSELGAFMSDAYPKLMGAIGAQGARPAGAPLARYFNDDPSAFDLLAAVPFEGAFEASGDVQVMELPGGKAAMTVHIGSYETLSAEYKRIMAWAKDRGTRLGDGPWEVYVNDPSNATQDQLRTEVYFPLAN